MRLGSTNPLSDIHIPSLSPDAWPNSFPINTTKPVESVSYYPSTYQRLLVTICISESDEEVVTACALPEELISTTGICDTISLVNVTHQSNILCICFYLISVSKIQDTIISLCMCKDRTHHATVVDSKSSR